MAAEDSIAALLGAAANVVGGLLGALCGSEVRVVVGDPDGV
jgi:hypothetical protein